MIGSVEVIESVVISEPTGVPIANLKRISNLKRFKCLKRTSIEVMNTCLEPLNHNQYTRNNKYAARIPRVRTEAGKKAFWFQGPKLYNELPNSLRQLDSFITFKYSLKQFYMDN